MPAVHAVQAVHALPAVPALPALTVAPGVPSVPAVHAEGQQLVPWHLCQAGAFCHRPVPRMPKRWSSAARLLERPVRSKLFERIVSISGQAQLLLNSGSACVVCSSSKWP